MFSTDRKQVRTHITLQSCGSVSPSVVFVVVSPQKSRETNRDLQIQLDQVLQQAQDPDSKGNSLFAEVKRMQRAKNDGSSGFAPLESNPNMFSL